MSLPTPNPGSGLRTGPGPGSVRRLGLAILCFVASGVFLLVASAIVLRILALVLALEDFGQTVTYVLETNPGILIWDVLFVWLALVGAIGFAVAGIVIRRRKLYQM